MTDIRFWHRIKLPDGTYTKGLVNHGPDGDNWPTTRFGMPEDLTGKSVLDIGSWDGFFSFEAEKRNAKEVLSTECSGLEDGFDYCKKALNSKVERMWLDIEKDQPLLNYDLVLCYGVLYHLVSPLKAMVGLSRLTGEICLLETAISTFNEIPVLEYKPGYDNDPTNYFYPNDKWIELAGKEVGFKKIDKIYSFNNRATYRMRK